MKPPTKAPSPDTIPPSIQPSLQAGDDEKAKAGETLGKRFAYLSDIMTGDYLFGDEISVADCYLFVMLLWAQKNRIEAPGELVGFRERMLQRPSVQTAMKHEGLV